jgi:hypothetical protein
MKRGSPTVSLAYMVLSTHTDNVEVAIHHLVSTNGMLVLWQAKQSQWRASSIKSTKTSSHSGV